MPPKKSYKSTLLLDLDETTFIALDELEFKKHGNTYESIKMLKRIHSCHTLSNYIVNSGYYFFVINPDKLKTMIESIYDAGDDIVIFTSGLWLRPVLSIISQLCNLSERASYRFNQSLFLNPQHDSEKLGIQQKNIATLLKPYRLHGLFRPVPELRDTHFVLLDNDRNHIASCGSCFYLDGVIATTDEDDMSFYEKVLEKMELAHNEGARRSPSSPCYYYPEVILKTMIQLGIQKMEEEKAKMDIYFQQS
ncbi:hypothetical protein B0B39_00550 [Legionella longbeachae]|uniref:hypothetical protein n=1 Tax=Legionella longbeachae TaxID=450 RepID=UPI000A1C0B6C|nr:hypothetical protein [Legionella longbeachae]ARM32117.1 hypothetical protein B0B39_00550 [Legionella longbeachae]